MQDTKKHNTGHTLQLIIGYGNTYTLIQGPYARKKIIPNLLTIDENTPLSQGKLSDKNNIALLLETIYDQSKKANTTEITFIDKSGANFNHRSRLLFRSLTYLMPSTTRLNFLQGTQTLNPNNTIYGQGNKLPKNIWKTIIEQTSQLASNKEKIHNNDIVKQDVFLGLCHILAKKTPLSFSAPQVTMLIKTLCDFIDANLHELKENEFDVNYFLYNVENGLKTETVRRQLIWIFPIAILITLIGLLSTTGSIIYSIKKDIHFFSFDCPLLNLIFFTSLLLSWLGIFFIQDNYYAYFHPLLDCKELTQTLNTALDRTIIDNQITIKR
jgi:hypothetical protein